MAHLAADNLIAYFSGKPLLTPLNPEVLLPDLTAPIRENSGHA
jgi:hypothetical protein